ncbi:hypothetical protein GTW43_01690 [Streptomyces sp. SID5785]|uniref:hypothetical protein n=1 Tax=Streptomyces sp. SID5785 TaxID=2690309 RepID=UPI00136126B3|nr:hypothetical protein [Streptomyces sp. SID5785]MZD03796.1 hypothetical protein [Streptomyces sp. SID5785]
MAELRRMPPGADGRSSYCQPGGVVAAVSDAIENDLVASAAVVLGLVRAALDGPRPTADEAWFMLRRLAECLTDALNVAELRGERLAERP